MFIIDSKDPHNSKFNGCKCKIVSIRRSDNFIEVLIPEKEILILVTQEELADE